MVVYQITLQFPMVTENLQIMISRNPFGKEVEKVNIERCLDYNIWVAVQVQDDLDYIIDRYADENHLVVGTDYGHTDTSAEIEALRILRDDGKIPAGAADKILGPNAARLYGLE